MLGLSIERGYVSIFYCKGNELAGILPALKTVITIMRKKIRLRFYFFSWNFILMCWKTIIKDYYNWMLGHVLWQTPLPLGVSIPWKGWCILHMEKGKYGFIRFHCSSICPNTKDIPFREGLQRIIRLEMKYKRLRAICDMFLIYVSNQSSIFLYRQPEQWASSTGQSRRLVDKERDKQDFHKKCLRRMPSFMFCSLSVIHFFF